MEPEAPVSVTILLIFGCLERFLGIVFDTVPTPVVIVEVSPIGRGFAPAGIVLGSSARSASTQPKEHTSRPLFHVPHESRRNAPTRRL